MPEKIAVRLSAVAPLLMSSPAGVNPIHPLVRAIKKLTSKPAKQKTEDDLIKILDLEFELRGYWDDDGTPYIPAEMIEAAIRNGARKSRKGKNAEAGVVVEPDRIPLVYTGPQTMVELKNDPNYRDVRPVGNKGNRVLRCRPRFNHWRLEFVVNYMPSVIDRQDVIEALDVAGQQCAIGDNRPRYGRFNVEVLE